MRFGLRASQDVSGLRCAYCHENFVAAERVTACTGCATTYHPDCLSEELGACACLGCGRVPEAGLRSLRGVDDAWWTVVPWLLIPTVLLSMRLATGGWVANVLESLAAMSGMCAVFYVGLLFVLRRTGLGGRR